MRKLLLAGVAVLALAGSARADCYYTTNGAPCMGSSCCTNIFAFTDGVPNCDANDKTPDEAAQCKLTYWRKEVDRRLKARDDAQAALDKANERVRAFERVAVPTRP